MIYSFSNLKYHLFCKKNHNMDHIAHLKNQCISINTFEKGYDYIYYNIGPVVQKETIFKFRECTFAILLLSPNVKRCNLSI